MGDFRVIGGVTQALALSVQRAISSPRSPVSHARVTTSRPDKQETGDAPRVNVYLFHVQPNASLRNLDVPTFMDQEFVDQPTLALDLYYLLSFYGNDKRNKLESQLLMGITMGALNARPFIDGEELKRAVGDDGKAEEIYHKVALSVENMSVHELSRLWQTFPQVPLVLSTAYKATAVLVSEKVDVRTPKEVIDRDFTLFPDNIGAMEDLPSAEEIEDPGPEKKPNPATFRQILRAIRGRSG